MSFPVDAGVLFTAQKSALEGQGGGIGGGLGRVGSSADPKGESSGGDAKLMKLERTTSRRKKSGDVTEEIKDTVDLGDLSSINNIIIDPS